MLKRDSACVCWASCEYLGVGSSSKSYATRQAEQLPRPEELPGSTEESKHDFLNQSFQLCFGKVAEILQEGNSMKTVAEVRLMHSGTRP